MYHNIWRCSGRGHAFTINYVSFRYTNQIFAKLYKYLETSDCKQKGIVQGVSSLLANSLVHQQLISVLFGKGQEIRQCLRIDQLTELCFQNSVENNVVL